MKRFWFGLVLLLALLAVGFTLGCSMNRIHLPLSQKLTQAAEAARVSDMDLAGRLLEDARQDWDRNRKLTAALIDHAPMEQIDSLFLSADNFCLAGDETETAAACGQLAALLRAMAEAHRLSWWTLL